MTTETVKSVCPYCGTGCGIVLEVNGAQVITVSGDKQHPVNGGRLCTKGRTCAQALSAPGRLTSAWLREHRRQEPVQSTMPVAIRETARRLQAIINQHGPDAVAFYVSGQMSLEAQYLANKLAKGFIGTRHIESNSRLCMASASSGYKLSLGADGPPGAYDDFDHADLFLVIGANMADCHPILFLRMMDRVKKGARLIVIDPRRTATAEKADLFLPIRPGTDLALLNGLLHLLVQNQHIDPTFIAGHTEGWEAMTDFLAAWTPASVARTCGLDEQDIRLAAQWIGETANWMSCWTMGLNQSIYGTWNTNALCNLHLATGAICRPGCGPFSLTGQPNAMGGREMGYMGPGLPGQRTLHSADDRAFTEALWQCPPGTLPADGGTGTMAMFDAMREGSIKACWIICTNPVASVPHRQTVIDGLRAAELVITQDAFLETETNRYADILLPGALWAEAEGVMVNSERTLTLMQQAVPPPGDAMADWQIIAAVAREMGYGEGFHYACAADVFDELKQASNPATGYDLRGASYARLRDTPVQWPCPPGDNHARHPIRYRHGDRLIFPTASGKAQFYPRPHLPAAEQPDAEYPMAFITGRLQHQWHTLTKTGKIATLNKLNPGPFVEIHPDDASRLHIQENSTVEIRSRRGRAVLPAVISPRIRPGTCFAPFHWSDVFGAELAVNAITHDATDAHSLQPGIKHCAVALAPITANLLRDTFPVATNLAASGTESKESSTMAPIETLATLLGVEAAPTLVLAPAEKMYMQGYLLGLRAGHTDHAAAIPTLPASAPFGPDARLMVDGMLAGLFAGRGKQTTGAAQPGAEPKKNAVTVLWASQTGSAETLAVRCAERLKNAGHSVTLMAMSDMTMSMLAKSACTLLITSTFGDGEPPDNGRTFWQALQSAQAPSLGHCRFSVLALGDTNYDQFCGFGRDLDARFAALGGTRLHTCLTCDADFDAAAGTWFGLMEAQLAAEASPSNISPAEPAGYSRNSPVTARLVGNRLLNGAGSRKETRHLVFDLAGADLSYQAGDALGVWPHNHPEQVSTLLKAFNLTAKLSVNVPGYGTSTLGDALTQWFDINKITPEMLALARQLAKEALPIPDDECQQKQWLREHQLIDLVQGAGICPDAATLTSVLSRLQPRLYSISSGPGAHPTQIHLTVSTVRYEQHSRQRLGVCSTFLADRAANTAVSVFIQRSGHFHLPEDPMTPVIMIGPGTGIAPFRGFLQERQARAAEGKNWLFFGEQHAACDFYYREELEAFARNGYLHRLDTAFSRDQTEKIYVQHRLLEAGAEIWTWLQEGAWLYVCGDAASMANDVDAALHHIAQTHGAMNAQEAAHYITRLKQEKRYRRDIY